MIDAIPARPRRCRHPHHLISFACSGTKHSDPGWKPVRERYDGPFWRTLRAAGPGGRCAKGRLPLRPVRLSGGRHPD